MSDEIDGLLKIGAESPLAAAIRTAIGATQDEAIRIYSPPHKTRVDGRVVTAVPFSREAFESLRSMGEDELVEMGCGRFDESGLMLFPREWYPFIPEGFLVDVIDGERRRFKPGETSDDCRYGMLAYGLLPNHRAEVSRLTKERDELREIAGELAGALDDLYKASRSSLTFHSPASGNARAAFSRYKEWKGANDPR